MVPAVSARYFGQLALFDQNSSRSSSQPLSRSISVVEQMSLADAKR